MLFTLMISTAFATILFSVYQLRSSVLVVTRAERAVSAANTLERLVLDVEAGRRGYALTHDRTLLEPWIHAQQQIPLRQQELASSVSGDPAQAARVTTLNSDVTAYLDTYADAALTDDGADPTNIDSQSITNGQKSVAALRGEFDEFTVAQRKIVDDMRADANRAGQRAVIAGIAGFATSLLAVAILTRSLAVVVVRPLHRLVTAADKVAGGDMTVRVDTSAPVEIGKMQRTFNSMVSALERSRETLGTVAAEQAALRRVATVAARGRPAGDVFATVTEEAGKLFGADAAVLVRFEADENVGTVVASWSFDPTHRIPLGQVELQGHGIAGQVMLSGRPVRMEGDQSADFLAREFGDTSIRSAIGAPIIVAGRTWGALKALSTSDRALEHQDAMRAAEFTDLVASAIANSQARADLTASRARVVAATDESRRRIERDLHDGTQQRLIALLLALRSTETQVSGGVQDRMHTMGDDLSQAIDELRELARGIHPSILSEGGLVPAIKSLGRRSPVPVEVQLALPDRLDTKIEVGVYYVVAEALTNAIRHARATLICVRAAVAHGRLELSIEDDGVGGADPDTGTGLVGLADRVATLGGSLHIASRQGRGTTLSITVPLAAAPDEGDGG
ncbi:CHASE3 domain-containing protein [Dactylosporangium sp. AC04546]|uniref:sensor histidine kinase n=1 Tax=Dactylosporangium sp. AC04546 TaxID=2862460 RepID=UPI001EDF6DBA|nr:CHASE3 domain-containing protein [Dactylosporangium sp. AC04546]WVK83400.1 CHASE3 domain-containing protein [Dactylosporangium sp. AC04546]